MGLTLTDTTKDKHTCDWCKHLLLRTEDPDGYRVYTLCRHELAEGYGRNAWRRDGVCMRFELLTREDIAQVLRNAKTCAYGDFIRRATQMGKDGRGKMDIFRLINNKIKSKVNSNEE